MLKIKDNVDLKELEEFGFEEKWFGLYGPGDYIPEVFYIKYYEVNNKRYYVETNHCFFDEQKLLKWFRLFRVTDTKYDKEISFKNIFNKVVRIITKDLITAGLVEKMEKSI